MHRRQSRPMTGLTGQVIQTRRAPFAKSRCRSRTPLAQSISGRHDPPVLAGRADAVRRRSVIGCARSRANARTPSTTRTIELLTTVAGTTAVALRNAQLFAETTQRNAELAVINDIGDALAKQLDFAGITEAVGERIRQIFEVSTVLILLYRPGQRAVLVPVHGRPGRAPRTRAEPGGGLSAIVVRGAASAPPRHARRDGRARRRLEWKAGRRVLAWRARPRRRSCARRHRHRSHATARLHASLMNGFCRRSPRAWAWHSRTRGCSTKPGTCCQTPRSAPPSYRSSTRSARLSRSNSISRRSSNS